MPGFAKSHQRYDLASKRAKTSKGKTHAGRPVVRGGQQLPRHRGKLIGPGTGRVKGISDIGELLPRTGKPRPSGRSSIEDRRPTRRPRRGGA